MQRVLCRVAALEGGIHVGSSLTHLLPQLLRDCGKLLRKFGPAFLNRLSMQRQAFGDRSLKHFISTLLLVAALQLLRSN